MASNSGRSAVTEIATGVGTLRVVTGIDTDRGTVVYDVSGQRIHGPVTITPSLPVGGDEGRPSPLLLPSPAASVRIGRLGDDTEAGCLSVHGISLVVPGPVRVTAADAADAADLADRPAAFCFSPRRWTAAAGGGGSVPRPTVCAAATILAALVMTWYRRPDLPALHRAAARHAAPGYVSRHLAVLSRLETRRDELAAEIAQHRQYLATARALIDTTGPA